MTDFFNKTPGAKANPLAPTDPLPQAARAKLLAIQGLAGDARDAAASAQRRMEDLKKALSYSEIPPADAAGIEHELSRLTAVRQQQNVRYQQLSALAGNILNWLTALPRSVELVAAPAVSAKPLKNETLTKALARIRAEIDSTRLVLRNVEAAPLPKADLKAKAREQVEALAAKGKPTLNTDRGTLTIAFTDPNSFGPSPQAPAALLAWLHADTMVARLEVEIDALPEPALAISALEKQRRIADLMGSIEVLERTEEALIARAAIDGVEVLRRRNADPRAVLGVMVKANGFASGDNVEIGYTLIPGVASSEAA
jgi:hypothetical protein